MASQGAYDVIVVGVDGSPGADAAVDHALRTGLERGCSVEIVTGWLWVGSSDAQSPSDLVEGRVAVQRVQDAVLERAAVRLGAMPDLTQTVVHDYAGRVLVARAEGASALVVGAGSLGATSTKMLGSGLRVLRPALTGPGGGRPGTRTGPASPRRGRRDHPRPHVLAALR